MSIKSKITLSIALAVMSLNTAAQETEPFQLPVQLTSDIKLDKPPQSREDVLQNVSDKVGKQTPTDQMLEFMSLEDSTQAEQVDELLGTPMVSDPKSDFVKQVEKSYKQVQKLVDVKPSSSIMVPVAQGLMNRINTPFKMVAVRDSGNDNVIVDLDGGMVFVTINSFEPMSLMVYEEGVPETMFSIMLYPMEAPPVMIEANVVMTDAMIAKREAFHKKMDLEEKLVEADNMARYQTQTSEHVKRIKEILTPVATGEIPRGFSFTEQIPARYAQPCSVSIYQKTKQRLIGARELVDVVHIRNDSNEIYSVREENCISKDTIAVAVLDKAMLQPGEETEVYVLRDKLYEQRQSKVQRRPRVAR